MTRSKHLEKTRRSSWTWRILGGILLFLFLVGCASSGSSGNTSIEAAGIATASAFPQQASKAAATSTNSSSSSVAPTVPSSFSTSTGLGNKPLQLPTLGAGGTCPVTMVQSGVVPGRQYALGDGPVYLVVTNDSPTLQYSAAPFIGDTSSELGGARSIWEINPNYQGTVLIRGRQLGGSNPLRFNGGLDQVNSNPEGTEPLVNDLRLNTQQAQNSSWASFVTFTRLRAPGCYGLQVDGQNFSEVIVFQASAS